MALEKTIQTNILKYLNSLKGCVAENVMGNAAQKNRPDINCCYKGKSYRIEVKSPDHGYMPSKGQILNLQRWAKAGAVCVVVWSVDEVRNIIEHSGNFNPNFMGWYITSKGEVLKGDEKCSFCKNKGCSHQGSTGKKEYCPCFQ